MTALNIDVAHLAARCQRIWLMADRAEHEADAEAVADAQDVLARIETQDDHGWSYGQDPPASPDA